MTDFTDRANPLLPAPHVSPVQPDVDPEETMDRKTAIDLAVIALGDKFTEYSTAGKYLLAGKCHNATQILERMRMEVERAD
jgi:hypothetical protein